MGIKSIKILYWNKEGCSVKEFAEEEEVTITAHITTSKDCVWT